MVKNVNVSDAAQPQGRSGRWRVL